MEGLERGELDHWEMAGAHNLLEMAVFAGQKLFKFGALDRKKVPDVLCHSGP